MSILKHLGILTHKGILSQKGILYANDLLPPSDGFSDYYQYLKLGDPADLEDYGTGGNDALLISGSMATKDIVINWTRGDVALTALAQFHGISEPEIGYDEMKSLKTSNLWTIEKH